MLKFVLLLFRFDLQKYPVLIGFTDKCLRSTGKIYRLQFLKTGASSAEKKNLVVCYLLMELVKNVRILQK